MNTLVITSVAKTAPSSHAWCEMVVQARGTETICRDPDGRRPHGLVLAHRLLHDRRVDLHFFIAAVKKRYERHQELANPKGFYGRHAPCTRLHADNTPAPSLPTHHDSVCSVFTTPPAPVTGAGDRPGERRRQIGAGHRPTHGIYIYIFTTLPTRGWGWGFRWR